jgi:hypothetical protein
MVGAGRHTRVGYQGAERDNIGSRRSTPPPLRHRSGPQEALPPFENWVRRQGAPMSEPDAQTGRYHCFTGGGFDGAEAAILNGAGPVGDGATLAYRERETWACTAKREFRTGH